MTLLEEAKKYSYKYHLSQIRDDEQKEDFIDFVIAFLEGDISYRQASKALNGKTAGQFSHYITGAIRRLYQAKKIKIIKL